MSEIVIGNCSKHPGQNMINCPLCDLDAYLKSKPEQEVDDFSTEAYPLKLYVPIDRQGNCPACNESWDGGDIFEVIQDMDAFMGKPKGDVIAIASQYGWTEQNKKRFSKVIGVEFTTMKDKLALLQCPTCNHVFNPETSQEFENLNEARNSFYE